MTLDLDCTKLAVTIQRNTATSYGLTLVAGMPLPADVTASLHKVQTHVETGIPRRFFWYDPSHLHITLYAPLRGRYRDHPPLQTDELPADIDGFAQDFCRLFASIQPFPLHVTDIRYTGQGYISASIHDGHGLQEQLASTFARYPELDLPDRTGDLHVTLGYLNTPCELLTNTEVDFLRTGFASAAFMSTDVLLVDKVYLVHYANRTLGRLLGRMPFALGHWAQLTSSQLLRELGIERPGNEEVQVR